MPYPDFDKYYSHSRVRVRKLKRLRDFAYLPQQYKENTRLEKKKKRAYFSLNADLYHYVSIQRARSLKKRRGTCVLKMFTISSTPPPRYHGIVFETAQLSVILLCTIIDVELNRIYPLRGNPLNGNPVMPLKRTVRERYRGDDDDGGGWSVVILLRYRYYDINILCSRCRNLLTSCSCGMLSSR